MINKTFNLGDRVAHMDSYVVGTVIRAWEGASLVQYDGEAKDTYELNRYLSPAQPYQEAWNKYRLSKLGHDV